MAKFDSSAWASHHENDSTEWTAKDWAKAMLGFTVLLVGIVLLGLRAAAL